MRHFSGTAHLHLDADPTEAFSAIIDVDGLPRWNAAIACVTERPPELGPGAQWTVRMQPHRFVRWGSRSTVDDLDIDARRFSYRTMNTDGNPSWTSWSWEVRHARPGAEVAVRWEVYLKTLDRRLLAGPIRRRELRREVAASLDALAHLLQDAPNTEPIGG